MRKLRAQAARSFGSNRVMAATDLLTVEVRGSCNCTDKTGKAFMQWAR